MNRRRRLDRLSERVLARHDAAGPTSGFPVDPDEDQWLAAFEAMGNAGHFTAEPDFPMALAEYRNALAVAHGQFDLPFDPPPKFRPLDLPRYRQRLWRSPNRFPAVCAGFVWLCEFFNRVHDGVPPVTEAEFAELAAWFLDHEDRLWPICLPSELLDLGDGDFESFANVRWGITKGPRESGAGETAVWLRKIRANYINRLAGMLP